MRALIASSPLVFSGLVHLLVIEDSLLRNQMLLCQLFGWFMFTLASILLPVAGFYKSCIWFILTASAGFLWDHFYGKSIEVKLEHLLGFFMGYCGLVIMAWCYNPPGASEAKLV